MRFVLISTCVVLASWALLALLAKRLPPGAAKDLATVLPACLTTARRLRSDPRVPRRARIAVAVAGLWVLSPIDLIPEFVPIIGPLDDVIVVALAFRYAARQVPREVLLEAWPAAPRILDRLLERRTAETSREPGQEHTEGAGSQPRQDLEAVPQGLPDEDGGEGHSLPQRLNGAAAPGDRPPGGRRTP